MTDLAMLNWVIGVAAIIFLGLLIGKVVYAVGGWIVDLIDKNVETGDE